MGRHRAVWTHIVLYLALAMVALVGGCVHGTPFEPEQCSLETDSTLVVVITPELMRLCAVPIIRTQIVKGRSK